MKTIMICTILLLVPLFAVSASVKEAKDSVLTIRQVDSLNKLANRYLEKKDYQKALECKFKIVDIYYKKGSIDSLVNSYNKLVGFFIAMKDFGLAEKYQRIMVNTARNTLTPVIQGWVFSNNAQINIGNGEYDHAIRNLYIAIVYFQKAKTPWMEARVYKLLGDAFVQKKLYDKAFFAYRTANSFFSQVPNDFEVSAIYTRIAHIYQLLNENQNNLEYNLMAMHVREKIGQSTVISSSYLNVGEAYWLLGRKDSGSIYMKKALKLAKQNNNTYLLEIIYSQLSDFAKQEKKFKDALQYYTTSIEYHKKLNQERNQSEIELLVANHTIRSVEARNDLLMQENQIQDLQFKNRRIQTIVYEIAFIALIGLILFINMLARNNRKRKMKLQALNERLKAEIHERFEAEGRLDRSEEMHRFLAENTVDVISLLDANMQRLYISPSCEKFYGYNPQEILQMNSPLDLVEPSHRVSVNYRLLELFRTKKSIQYRYQALRKDGTCFWAESNINPILDPESGEIEEMITVVRDISGQMIHEEELAENARQKEYLLREIHNRVKNNFAILISLMSMQRDQTHDSELNSSITDLQLRVRTMSLVHEQLYRTQDISAIPFDDYLRHLTLIISSSFKNDRIRLETDIRHCILPIEMALPMGLIVNELMTNAYKYAFPANRSGTVWVKLLPEDDGKHTISICDDGIGLPVNFTMKDTQSMGSQIVRLLVEQVEAHLEFNGSKGASFRILFSTRQLK
jgi:PAS domain S-box-containing protein